MSLIQRDCPCDIVLHEGWLEQRSHHIGIWKKRYFVLYENGVLAYWRKKPDVLRESIDDRDFPVGFELPASSPATGPRETTMGRATAIGGETTTGRTTIAGRAKGISAITPSRHRKVASPQLDLVSPDSLEQLREKSEECANRPSSAAGNVALSTFRVRRIFKKPPKFVIDLDGCRIILPPKELIAVKNSCKPSGISGLIHQMRTSQAFRNSTGDAYRPSQTLTQHNMSNAASFLGDTTPGTGRAAGTRYSTAPTTFGSQLTTTSRKTTASTKSHKKEKNTTPLLSLDDFCDVNLSRDQDSSGDEKAVLTPRREEKPMKKGDSKKTQNLKVDMKPQLTASFGGASVASSSGGKYIYYLTISRLKSQKYDEELKMDSRRTRNEWFHQFNRCLKNLQGVRRALIYQADEQKARETLAKGGHVSRLTKGFDGNRRDGGINGNSVAHGTADRRLTVETGYEKSTGSQIVDCKDGLGMQDGPDERDGGRANRQSRLSTKSKEYVPEMISSILLEKPDFLVKLMEVIENREEPVDLYSWTRTSTDSGRDSYGILGVDDESDDEDAAAREEKYKTQPLFTIPDGHIFFEACQCHVRLQNSEMKQGRFVKFLKRKILRRKDSEEQENSKREHPKSRDSKFHLSTSSRHGSPTLPRKSVLKSKPSLDSPDALPDGFKPRRSAFRGDIGEQPHLPARRKTVHFSITYSNVSEVDLFNARKSMKRDTEQLESEEEDYDCKSKRRSTVHAVDTGWKVGAVVDVDREPSIDQNLSIDLTEGESEANRLVFEPLKLDHEGVTFANRRRRQLKRVARTLDHCDYAAKNNAVASEACDCKEPTGPTTESVEFRYVMLFSGRHLTDNFSSPEKHHFSLKKSRNKERKTSRKTSVHSRKLLDIPGRESRNPLQKADKQKGRVSEESPRIRARSKSICSTSFDMLLKKEKPVVRKPLPMEFPIVADTLYLFDPQYFDEKKIAVNRVVASRKSKRESVIPRRRKSEAQPFLSTRSLLTDERRPRKSRLSIVGDLFNIHRKSHHQSPETHEHDDHSSEQIDFLDSATKIPISSMRTLQRTRDHHDWVLTIVYKKPKKFSENRISEEQEDIDQQDVSSSNITTTKIRFDSEEHVTRLITAIQNSKKSLHAISENRVMASGEILDCFEDDDKENVWSKVFSTEHLLDQIYSAFDLGARKKPNSTTSLLEPQDQDPHRSQSLVDVCLHQCQTDFQNLVNGVDLTSCAYPENKDQLIRGIFSRLESTVTVEYGRRTRCEKSIDFVSFHDLLQIGREHESPDLLKKLEQNVLTPLVDFTIFIFLVRHRSCFRLKGGRNLFRKLLLPVMGKTRQSLNSSTARESIGGTSCDGCASETQSTGGNPETNMAFLDFGAGDQGEDQTWMTDTIDYTLLTELGIAWQPLISFLSSFRRKYFHQFNIFSDSLDEFLSTLVRLQMFGTHVPRLHLMLDRILLREIREGFPVYLADSRSLCGSIAGDHQRDEPRISEDTLQMKPTGKSIEISRESSTDLFTKVFGREHSDIRMKVDSGIALLACTDPRKTLMQQAPTRGASFNVASTCAGTPVALDGTLLTLNDSTRVRKVTSNAPQDLIQLINSGLGILENNVCTDRMHTSFEVVEMLFSRYVQCWRSWVLQFHQAPKIHFRHFRGGVKIDRREKQIEEPKSTGKRAFFRRMGRMFSRKKSKEEDEFPEAMDLSHENFKLHMVQGISDINKMDPTQIPDTISSSSSTTAASSSFLWSAASTNSLIDTAKKLDTSEGAWALGNMEADYEKRALYVCALLNSLEKSFSGARADWAYCGKRLLREEIEAPIKGLYSNFDWQFRRNSWAENLSFFSELVNAHRECMVFCVNKEVQESSQTEIMARGRETYSPDLEPSGFGTNTMMYHNGRNTMMYHNGRNTMNHSASRKTRASLDTGSTFSGAPPLMSSYKDSAMNSHSLRALPTPVRRDTTQYNNNIIVNNQARDSHDARLTVLSQSDGDSEHAKKLAGLMSDLDTHCGFFDSYTQNRARPSDQEGIDPFITHPSHGFFLKAQKDEICEFQHVMCWTLVDSLTFNLRRRAKLRQYFTAGGAGDPLSVPAGGPLSFTWTPEDARSVPPGLNVQSAPNPKAISSSSTSDCPSKTALGGNLSSYLHELLGTALGRLQHKLDEDAFELVRQGVCKVVYLCVLHEILNDGGKTILRGCCGLTDVFAKIMHVDTEIRSFFRDFGDKTESKRGSAGSSTTSIVRGSANCRSPKMSGCGDYTQENVDRAAFRMQEISKAVHDLWKTTSSNESDGIYLPSLVSLSGFEEILDNPVKTSVSRRPSTANIEVENCSLENALCMLLDTLAVSSDPRVEELRIETFSEAYALNDKLMHAVINLRIDLGKARQEVIFRNLNSRNIAKCKVDGVIDFDSIKEGAGAFSVERFSTQATRTSVNELLQKFLRRRLPVVELAKCMAEIATGSTCSKADKRSSEEKFTSSSSERNSATSATSKISTASGASASSKRDGCVRKSYSVVLQSNIRNVNHEESEDGVMSRKMSVDIDKFGHPKFIFDDDSLEFPSTTEDCMQVTRIGPRMLCIRAWQNASQHWILLFKSPRECHELLTMMLSDAETSFSALQLAGSTAFHHVCKESSNSESADKPDYDSTRSSRNSKPLTSHIAQVLRSCNFPMTLDHENPIKDDFSCLVPRKRDALLGRTY